MCLTAFAIGGAALGGLFQSRAANNATDAQQDASQQQIDLQRGIYNDQKARFQPYYSAGTNALSQYQNEIGNMQGYTPYGEQMPGFEEYGAQMPGFEEYGAQMPGFQEYGAQMPEFQSYGQAMPEYQDFNYESSPGYQFQLQQGQQAIDGSAASRGGLFSGATLKAQQEYGTGLAAQDYNSQFQNHLADYSTRLGAYQTGFNSNLADYGARAGQYQQGFGNNMANYQARMANYQQGFGNNMDNYQAQMANYQQGFGNNMANYQAQLGNYQQGFGNYQTEYGNMYGAQNDYLNRLGGLVSGGMGAAGMQANAGNNFAQGASTALGSYGDATAAGAIAQGNALTGAINNAMGALSYGQTQGPMVPFARFM